MRAGPYFWSLWVLAVAAAAGGCANYQLGTQGRLAFATLYVAPVQNRTLLPQAQEVVTTQLRSALANDGRVRLVNSPDGADASLSVVIVDYHREVAAVREQDTGLAGEFSETLGVLCTLTDNRARRPFFENRPVHTQRDVYVDNGNPHSSLVGDQLQAEYNSVPLLAESIAGRIAHAVLDVW